MTALPSVQRPQLTHGSEPASAIRVVPDERQAAYGQMPSPVRRRSASKCRRPPAPITWARLVRPLVGRTSTRQSAVDVSPSLGISPSPGSPGPGSPGPGSPSPGSPGPGSPGPGSPGPGSPGPGSPGPGSPGPGSPGPGSPGPGSPGPGSPGPGSPGPGSPGPGSPGP